MRLGAWLLLSSLTLGVGAYACAYPEFEFRPDGVPGGTGAVGGSGAGGDGGSTSTGGSGGPGGSGGTGGSTTSTGGGDTGGSAGTGGSGGSGGGPCMPWVIGQCEDGEKCTVVDVESGATGCDVAGQQPSWTKCIDNHECLDGDWCDATTQTCKPVCNTAGDCPANAQCIQARTAGDVDIPGLQVCTANCHPRNVGPCSQAHGPTNCVYRGAEGYGFDCWASGNVGEGDGCTHSYDCRGGLTCIGECHAWCRPLGWPSLAHCGFFSNCDEQSPGVYYNGDEWGICHLS